MTGGKKVTAFEVLVAEADDLQLQLVDVLLSDPRFHLARAATARAALEYLKANTPDLILAAADLPDLDGYSLVSRVKRVARLARIPVILTTEADAGLGLSQRTRRRAEEAQVDLLLPRPLGDKNLKERALRLLQPGGGQRKADAPAPEARLGTTLVLDETLEGLPRPVADPTNATRSGAAPATRSSQTGEGAAGTEVTGTGTARGGAIGAAAAGSEATETTPQPLAQAHLARAERESLLRENAALRNENRELRANIERLRRELNEARQVGRPGRR